MIRFLPTRSSAEDDEIRHHLIESADRLIAEGWEPEAAMAEARRRFGNIPRVRRRLGALRRSADVAEALHSVVNDARYAARALVANKVFAFAVIVTLALGIGAGSSMFAVVDAAIVRPLEFPDAERWVEV